MKRLSSLVALVLVPSAVFATVVISETIEEMARGATMVVRGQIVQVQPQLEESSGRINTYADIQVTEVLKGARVGSILVKQPGGQIGNRGTHVAGAGQFAAGQDAVLFLEQAPDEPGVFILRGLAAGKVDLESSRTSELKAVRKLGGLSFYDRNSPLRVVQKVEDLGNVDVFLSRLRRALKAGEK